MNQALGKTILIYLCGFLCGSQMIAKPITENFPEIDQRQIEGADDRCGTIALGSWLVCFSVNGHPSLIPANEIPHTRNNPFSAAPLSPKAKQALHEIDQLCGGDGEIKLLRLVEGLVDYLHRLPDESLLSVIHYYNLPNELLIRQLYDQNASFILFYGIYDVETTTEQLSRKVGHWDRIPHPRGDGPTQRSGLKNHEM